MSAISVSHATSTPSSAQSSRHTASVTTWPVYTTLFASLSIVVGLVWDISWHRTIGRDTFWSPPHVLEQLAAIVAGVSCGWLVLHTTFAKTSAARAMRDVSVKVWGFYGPLGAWVCIWGTAMMIVSAPFDNWWHNAYGLDVKIISPPHTVLAMGMIAIELGALLVALAVHNRADAALGRAGGNGIDSGTAFSNPTRFNLTYVVAAGVILVMLATAVLERAGFANTMHGSTFYQITALILPMAMVAFGRGVNLRWAVTKAAATYMVISVVLIWTLQLFKATPMLAPIYNPVTHMVPPPFPYLLIVPAFFIDVLLQRVGQGRDWRLAVLLGSTFVLSLLAVQWVFADFLMSPSAHNFFFAAGKWDYSIRPGEWQHIYWNFDELDANGKLSIVKFARGIGIAIAIAILMARAGLGIGNAMRRVVR